MRFGNSLGTVTVPADPPFRSILPAVSASPLPAPQPPDALFSVSLPSARMPNSFELYTVSDFSAAKLKLKKIYDFLAI